jgi:hypothetical protein
MWFERKRQGRARGEDGCYGLLTVADAHLLRGVQVFLDGAPLDHTFAADDRQGWVLKCVEPLRVNEYRDDVVTELLFGTVTFKVGIWEPTNAD